jgi:ABC-type branched-subunit amino acid transport system permease subunit
VLTIALTYVIFAIGLDFIWGYGGIMSFGHATFFGLGAYITAKALTEGWIPGFDIAIILIATAVPAVLGLILALGLFYQRIDPLNFAVLTLVLAAIGEQAATSLSSVTGGSNGIGGIPVMSFGIPGVIQYEPTSVAYYYFALALAVVAYLTAWWMLRSRFGTVLISIRENETKTRALGYNVEIYKSLAFGIGCAFAGFSGAIYATHVGFISPSVLGFILSTQVVIWVLIGGKGTLLGAFIGPIVMRLLERELSQALLFSWQLVVGLILIIMVLIFPGGLVSIYGKLENKLTSSSP